MRLLYILLLLAVIVVAEEMKWAPIPASHEPLLWKSVAMSRHGGSGAGARRR